MAKAGGRRADPLYVSMYRRRTGERRPIPPFELRARIGIRPTNLSGFFETGEEVAATVRRALADGGAPLEEAQALLDFGCGCGRVISHLARDNGHAVRLHGCDVDANAVAWAGRAYPSVDFTASGYAPPLPYPDGRFDVLYSISILTHLDETSQDAWLAELKRILAPGGVALLTTNGEHVLDWYLTSPAAVERVHGMRERLAARGRLGDEGFVFEPYTRAAWHDADFSGVEESYGLTFHSERYVRERWGEWFEVLRFEPAAINSGQDLVLVAKRHG
ncbi:MAG: class I SAM-dependent methyltransferase [Thermoleophilaceae bacterium]